MTFMQKLTKDRGKFMRISMDAKDYIRGNEVRSVKWNGREIRNGGLQKFRCAVKKKSNGTYQLFKLPSLLRSTRMRETKRARSCLPTST